MEIVQNNLGQDVQIVQNSAKSVVSMALVARFSFSARFASERNGRCCKRSSVAILAQAILAQEPIIVLNAEG